MSNVVARNKKLNELTLRLISETAKDVHGAILKHQKPDLAFPIRSLKNVLYSTKKGYFEIGWGTTWPATRWWRP